MLPAGLKSVYQQYKDDTNAVATWLATTAKAHGYTVAQPAQSGRLKGKARKAAKVVQKKPLTSSNGVSTTQYVLKVAEFEPMALFLSKLEGIQVPDAFAIAIERAIRVRKSFSLRLSEGGLALDARANDGHEYFVTVLEKVRGFLQPLMKSPTWKQPASSKTKPSVDSDKLDDNVLSNMFAHLGLYEPSEAFLNAPDAVLPDTTGLTYAVEADNLAEEVSIAVMSLLADYGRLGDALEELWGRYEDEELDLAAVSVATNTAFELARSWEDDIAPMVEKVGGTALLMEGFFRSLSETMGINPDDKELPSDQYNLEAYQIAKSCLINTMAVVMAYASSCGDDELPGSTYNGKFGWYDEELGDLAGDNRASYQQDKTAMLEFLPDLHFMSSDLDLGNVEDELIRGMRMVLKSPDKVPFWFAWATQIYLNILQSLGSSCSKGYRDMERVSFSIKRAAADDTPSPSKERDRLLSLAYKWDEDPIHKFRQKMVDLGVLPSVNPPEFRFLHRNPMHCGLWIHTMRSAFHLTGVQYAAAPGAVMAVGQLYHALRQERLLPEDAVWKDMEALREMQGNGTFFVGGPPTDRDGYFTNFCLGLGLSVSNWAPHRRQAKGKGKKAPKPNVNDKNRRNMKIMGWVSHNMDRRAKPADERQPLSAKIVESLLEAGRRHEILDGKGHVQQGKEDAARELKANNKPLTPSGLLTSLAEALDLEISALNFNYFAMHNTAHAILQAMKTKLQQLIGPDVTRYVPDETKLPFVVGYAFSTAAGQAGLEHKGPGSDNLLQTGAEAVREVVLDAGKGDKALNFAVTNAGEKEIARPAFREENPWRLDDLMREVQMMMRQGGRDQRSSSQECPVQ